LQEKKVVNRDIKLSNMKISAEGLVKLFDFGLSSDDGSHVTATSRGTAVYRAPELYKTPALVSKPCDGYAFGICCWALLTNSMPKVLVELPPQKSARAPSIRT
jgi:serine/threonine-protein kinase